MKARTVLVTGGTGAIGTAICRSLAQAGARVAATSHPLEADRIAQWQAEQAAAGCNIQVTLCDVADYADVGRALSEIEQALGPVDVLVNAAGITRDGRLQNMTPQQWRDVLSVNLDGVFNVTRQVLEGMTTRGYGRVINISSINGQKGQFGQANYSASKAGVHGFTMAVAQEVARKGVTVNTVSPGYIETPMTLAVPADVRQKIVADIPVGRMGQPEDIARTVVFLADEAAGFITGANLSVNGGHFMS